MAIRVIMKNGDTALKQRLKYALAKDGPISVSVDSGQATIHKVIDDVMVPDVTAIVTPATPQTIYGLGEWDVVRSGITVSVESAVVEE